MSLKISKLNSAVKAKSLALPKEKGMRYEVKSLTPKICSSSGSRLGFKTKGLCQVEVSLSDSSGNSYIFVKRFRYIG